MNIEFGKVEPDAVDEDPEGATTTNEDRLPPPIVVLRAELDVCCYNRDFDDGHDVDDADDGQESKDIVVSALVLPQASEDEQQLNEDDCKRHQPGQ